MEFYCFHCDQIIPSSEMIGDRHKNCLNWPHPMTLHPAYEKDAKAPLPSGKDWGAQDQNPPILPERE